MKITSIKAVGKREVYDISVKDAEHYVLENGVVTHNTGGTYSATNIFFISKSQEKEGTSLQGFTFKIKMEKSRYVKEGSIIPITVNFKGGINKYTGLLDIAVELGNVIKPKNGWYARVMFDKKTGEVIEDTKSWRKNEIDGEWWETLYKNSDFKEKVKAKFKYSETDMISRSIEVIDEEDGDE